MAVLEVIKYGDPILRQQTRNVDNISRNKYQSLIDDMFETMYDEKGVGLAANQINLGLNILVLDISRIIESLEEEGIACEEKDIGKRIFFNTKIIDTEGSCIMEEGCLSIPEIRASIKRPDIITYLFL